MAGRKKVEELVVITKTYDLILWSCNHTGKFPRNHRFVLGEGIETRVVSKPAVHRREAGWGRGRAVVRGVCSFQTMHPLAQGQRGLYAFWPLPTLRR